MVGTRIDCSHCSYDVLNFELIAHLHCGWCNIQMYVICFSLWVCQGGQVCKQILQLQLRSRTSRVLCAIESAGMNFTVHLVTMVDNGTLCELYHTQLSPPPSCLTCSEKKTHLHTQDDVHAFLVWTPFYDANFEVYFSKVKSKCEMYNVHAF